jgi:hypothetical protein
MGSELRGMINKIAKMAALAAIGLFWLWIVLLLWREFIRWAVLP